jgi:hypothetical protein
LPKDERAGILLLHAQITELIRLKSRENLKILVQIFTQYSVGGADTVCGFGQVGHTESFERIGY